jgi:hypothetical protein
MIFTEELMNPIFDILENCRGVEQMDEHHPEGDVFTKKLSKCLYLADSPWLPELAQLARWDKLARSPKKKVKYDREEIMERLNNIGMSRFKREE